MLLRNSFQFVLQTRQLLRKCKIQRLGKAHLEEHVICGSSPYSTNDINKFECSSTNDNVAEEFDFELPEEAINERIVKFCEGDGEKLAKLKHTQLLISLLREKGADIPQKLRESDWVRLLRYKEKKDQISYLNLLYRREKRRNYEQTLSQINRAKFEKRKQEEQAVEVTTSGPIIYTLRYNSLFHRIHETKLENFYNYKLLQAMMFAPTVLVDCGYESCIRQKDTDNAAVFLINMWATNRNHTYPFHVVFCNLSSQGQLMERLREKLLLMDDPAYPFFYTSKSYFELYPSEKLVYLTADARMNLEKFSHDDVYILGGLPSLANNEPLSRAKAKQEGLRMAKFPFKQYDVKLNWNQQSLQLPLVISILNDLRETNDWKYAFRHIDPVKNPTVNRSTKMHALDHAVKEQQHIQATYNMLLTHSK